MREPSLYITYSLFIRQLRRQVWAYNPSIINFLPQLFEPPVSERNDYLHLSPTIQKINIQSLIFSKSLPWATWMLTSSYILITKASRQIPLLAPLGLYLVPPKYLTRVILHRSVYYGNDENTVLTREYVLRYQPPAPYVRKTTLICRQKRISYYL